MKTIQLLLAILLSTAVASSQTIPLKVIAPSGNFSESSSYKISYTVGETFVNTIQTSQTSFTTGFQQAWNLTVGFDDILGDFEVVAYPNPVDELLTIKFNKISRPFIIVDIFSIKGEKLMSKKIFGPFEGKRESFNVSRFNSGMFLIRISSGESNEIKTIPIIKR